MQISTERAAGPIGAVMSAAVSRDTPAPGGRTAMRNTTERAAGPIGAVMSAAVSRGTPLRAEARKCGWPRGWAHQPPARAPRAERRRPPRGTPALPTASLTATETAAAAADRTMPR